MATRRWPSPPASWRQPPWGGCNSARSIAGSRPPGRRTAELQRTGVASLRDALTGLYNRRGLVVRVRQMFGEVSSGETLALMILKIDQLESIEVVPGPSIADQVKFLFARRLQEALGHAYALGRLRNERFIAFCRDTDIDTAFDVAAKLCTAIAEEPFDTSDGARLMLTVSVGGCWQRVDSQPPPPFGRHAPRGRREPLQGPRPGGGQVVFSDI